ncbi:hypothetical protein BKA70DRAFT_1435773 [Coprinopsis sp. MPI-PUGE-AT-0042]|nr:hypothetical protein BKA70DRAFT_1435773 [Coprinopsis sp. MPI-PUGE-AT-0042]
MVLQKQGGDDRSTDASHSSVAPESRDPIVQDRGYFTTHIDTPRLRYLIRLWIAFVKFLYALLKVILSPYLFWKIFAIYWREGNLSADECPLHPVCSHVGLVVYLWSLPLALWLALELFVVLQKIF